MKTDKPSHLLPKLRFSEFSEAPTWPIEQLGRLFDERRETGFPELPLLSITDRDGVIPQEKTNRKSTANSNKAKYLRVVPGDIAYNTMRMWEGRSARVDMEGLVSPAYTVCRPNLETNSYFFAYYFKTRSLIKRFRKYSQGLVKDTLNLKYQPFSLISVGFPPPKEQQKIADCLGSLDELIAAEGRKLEALRQHKQGLMQQLFPQPGESTPRLRFPEFHDAGEWRLRKLEKLVLVRSGGTPSKGNPEYWNGSIPWVSAKDMKRLYLEDTIDHISIAAVNDGAKLVSAGTLLMLTRGMTLRKNVPICVLRREMSFNQDVKALLPKTGVKGLFLIFSLLANVHRLLKMVDIAGHGTGKLNTYELKAFALAFPKPAEQRRIATCFSSLEDVLAAQVRKVDALKQQKQGLLQQLFPSLETE